METKDARADKNFTTTRRMTCVESFLERLRVVSGVVRFGTKGSDIECVGLSGSSKDPSARSSMRVGTRTAVG